MSAEQRTPESLRTAAMQPVWRAVRSRLDRYGPDHRSLLMLGDSTADAALVLRSLLGRSGAKVDLTALESSLVQLGVGADLDAALTALGHPASQSAVERRAARARAAEVRARINQAVGDWPEQWAARWAAEVVSSGALSKLEPQEVEELAFDVRRLLDVVNGDSISPPLARDRLGRWSRVDVAARLYGSSHALDSLSLLERLCRRALALRLDGPAPLAEESEMSEHDVWEESTFHLDRVSSPILTWGLNLDSDSAIAELARASTSAGIPLAITTAALERWPVAGTSHRGSILVVENPRVVEAAADAAVGFPVVTTNGNPRRNVTALVSDLIAAGNEIYFHGDFDSAGLAICTRMVGLGCRPYAMSDIDYNEACDRAAEDGVALPTDDYPTGPTPWSPLLRRSFNEDRSRQTVHEEFVLSDLLTFDS